MIRSEKARGSSAPKQLQVRPERSTAHVFEIKLGLFGFNADLVKSIELIARDNGKDLLFIAEYQRRHSGDAGTILQVQTFVMRQFRAWPDQTHVASQHIPELRQFVKFMTAQKYANGRNPGVASYRNRRPWRTLYSHRAKFIERKFFPVPACPALPEECRTGRVHAHE